MSSLLMLLLLIVAIFVRSDLLILLFLTAFATILVRSVWPPHSQPPQD